MEKFLPPLMKGSDLASIAGITFRDGEGKIVSTPPRAMLQDLDLLPLPDRGAINLREYIETWKVHHGTGSVSIICARGCPFTCTWCSRSVFGESHRRHSAKSVVDEIEHIPRQYAPDMLWFVDDVFTMHHKWIHEFHGQMQRPTIRIPFA